MRKIGAILGVVIGIANPPLGSIIGQAVDTLAERSDTVLTPADAGKVTAELVKALPPPQATEALWPQLVRYAISGAGVALASRGYGTAADYEFIAGAVLAVAPPAWRVATTVYYRVRALFA